MSTPEEAVTLEQLAHRMGTIEKLLKVLGGFAGLTLIGLLTFAFFLGSLSTTVSSSAETIKQVHQDVSTGEKSLMVRTSLIESRLSSIDSKLGTMDTKLDAIKTQTLRERTAVRVRTLSRVPR
jgi:hypothetical protein